MGVSATPIIGVTPPLPRFIQIEPVGRCNLRCQMCAIQFRDDAQPHRPAAFIDEAVFRRLIEQFGPLEELQLQGLGEPMMHPRFFEMVRFAAARGIRVSTNSNLTLLTPARARLCVESGLSTLHVSIDGARAETYESIRVGAGLRKVLRNLDRLIEAKRCAASATPAVRIVMVLMRRNLPELPAIVELAAAHGVNEVFVQRLCHDFTEGSLPERYVSMREFVEQERLRPEDAAEMEATYALARTAAERLGVEVRLPPTTAHIDATSELPRCRWPWDGAYLSYRGEAMPCCMVSTPDRIQFGNMASDGVEAVWANAPYQAFRKALASDAPPDICRGCAVYRREF
jgi:MoaA/NifB/PqqE/SkfB family radical SAM enzyme